MSLDGWLTLVTVFLVLVALIREAFRPDVVFLAGLIFLMVTNVLTPLEAFSGFSNPAVFTVGALFIVAAGVQKTSALKFLDRLVFDDKLGPRQVLARMMASTALMSSFLNNTPIVAMLIPQVQAWSARTGISASRLLIPLSYAAIVGGVITLIGTSTNLIVSGMLEQRDMEPLTLFELTWIGLPATLLVVLWFVVIGYKLLPDRSDSSLGEGQGAANRYQMDLLLPQGSEWAYKTVDQAGLRGLENAFLVHVHRKGHTIGPVGPHFVLEEGDILTFMGEVRHIDELAVRKNLQRATPTLDAKTRDLPLYEAVVAPTSILIGKTLKGITFRERFHGVVIGIQRQNESIRGALGNVAVKTGDLLLIEAREGFDEQWNNDKDNFYLVTPSGRRELPVHDKAGLALVTVVLMILAATTGLLPIVAAAMIAAFVMLFSGCVQKDQAMGALNIPILLVIASAIGLGQAIDKTGLAVDFASLLLKYTAVFGPIAIIASIYILTNILTEMITNNAAAVLMLPIALAVGLEAGVTPHAMAVTVAVAASASFLTPIGYQTNLMVMGAGKYRFSDYFRAGLPVTLILMVTTVTMVMVIWY